VVLNSNPRMASEFLDAVNVKIISPVISVHLV